ncbi:hypothetical protein PLANPX_2498 [Lacipirellula parvula]|uniref:Uncharacterized protein n=1 Tax=Lacipirellula parvula TaxID=2650471 RepID=A0A5K7XEX7_9BACT|nr:hypothetical protein PLANPX_2498 [Lacipirellula parvula]
MTNGGLKRSSFVIRHSGIRHFPLSLPLLRPSTVGGWALKIAPLQPSSRKQVQWQN